MQEWEEGILSSRYPTPPAAPPKDDYIYESEDESQSPLRQAPARVFRHGKLKIHKTYNGPVPLTYVDTGVYEGGGNDYYEAYTEQDLHLEPPYLEISWYIPGISQGYDHLCRKTGIYQVYTCHMTTIFISQVYTWYIPVPCFFK